MGCNRAGDFGSSAPRRQSKSYPLTRCPACWRQHRRDLERAKRLGHDFVDAAPDLEVPRRLRVELEQLREQGVAFPTAWQAAANQATSELSEPEAVSWQQAFRSTRPAWDRAYHGTGAELPLAV